MNEIDVRSCGFLIFRTCQDTRQRQFLLMKHKNRWDLPKGHVDPGETQMECALRELLEETAIKDSDITVDSNFRFTQRYQVRYSRNNFEPQEKELVIFLATLDRPVELIITEHIGFEWFCWNPPHSIQEETIDPLLKSVAEYWGDCR